jgi:hypothetical protein
MSIEEENEDKAGEVPLVRTEGLMLILDTPKGTLTRILVLRTVKMTEEQAVVSSLAETSQVVQS